MSNHLPTEEQKKTLRAEKWEPHYQSAVTENWIHPKGDEIAFAQDDPPAAYGFRAIVMLEKLGIPCGEFEMEGTVDAEGWLGDFPATKAFAGKRLKIRYEVIED